MLFVTDSGDFSHYDPLPTTPAPHRRPTTTTTPWTHGVHPTKTPYRKKHITLPPKKIKIPPRSTQAPRTSTDATVKLPRKKPTHKTNKKPRMGGVVGGRLKRVQKNGESPQDAGRNVGRCNTSHKQRVKSSIKMCCIHTLMSEICSSIPTVC